MLSINVSNLLAIKNNSFVRFINFLKISLKSLFYLFGLVEYRAIRPNRMFTRPNILIFDQAEYLVASPIRPNTEYSISKISLKGLFYIFGLVEYWAIRPNRMFARPNILIFDQTGY